MPAGHRPCGWQSSGRCLALTGSGAGSDAQSVGELRRACAVPTRPVAPNRRGLGIGGRDRTASGSERVAVTAGGLQGAARTRSLPLAVLLVVAPICKLL